MQVTIIAIEKFYHLLYINFESLFTSLNIYFEQYSGNDYSRPWKSTSLQYIYNVLVGPGVILVIT